MDFGQIVASIGIGSLLTAAGAVINGWIKAKSDAKTAERKTDSELDLAEDAQEFNHQSEIIEDLRQRIVSLEKANDICVEDRIKLHREIGKLEGRLNEQNDAMKHLRHTTTEQNRDAVKQAGEVAAKGIEVAAQLALSTATQMSDSAIRLQQQAASNSRNIDKLTDRDIPVQDDSVHH